MIRDHPTPRASRGVGSPVRPSDHSEDPGSFRTKVITKGVDPQLTIYYKSSRLKQYFKEGRALRT